MRTEAPQNTLSLSERLLALKPSPTMALNNRAQIMAKQGIDVINFTVGEPDLATPRPIVDVAIASLRAGRTKYGPAGGGEDLRQTIAAKLLRDNQLQFAPTQIVCGMGAKEILFHAFLATLNEGDEVILPAPYWVSIPEQIRAAGGVPVVVPPPQDGSGTINIAGIERAVTARTRAISLNSPNNPAGYVWTKGEASRLADFLVDRPWWIISDEIYEYLAFERPHVSLLQLRPELADRFILVNGMSKSFAMTGWRVGYAAGPDPVIKLMRSLQSHSSTCLPGFIEDASAFALRQGRPLMAEGIASIDQRRILARDLARATPALKVAEPEGAFYLWIDCREHLGAGKRWATSHAFAEELLEKFHVACVPGEAFGGAGFLRLSYTTSAAKVEQGIRRIKEALLQ